MTINVKDLKKNCKFYRKIAKIREVKKLKTIPLPQETTQQSIIKLPWKFLSPEAEKCRILTRNFKNLKKDGSFVKKKMLKFAMLKS